MKLAPTLALAPLLITTTFAGDVLEVGPMRPFASISSAVAAAGNGDVVLVDPGTYAEDVDLDVGVTIVARSGEPTVVGHVTIGPLAGSQAVVLSGLRFEAEDTPLFQPGTEPVVRVRNCRGAVRLQDVTILATPPGSYSKRSALVCRTSDNVVATGSTFVGGTPLGATAVVDGTTAISVERSATVELDASEVLGGQGSFGFNGGLGAAACEVQSRGSLLAYDSTLRGGDGGRALDFFGGSGGAGLSIAALGSAQVQGVDLIGGAGGIADFGTDGNDGPPWSGAGALTVAPGTTRTLVAPTLVRASDPGWSVTTGQLIPGETSSLWISFASAPRYFDSIVRDLRVQLQNQQLAVQYDPQGPDANGDATRSFGPTVPPTGEDAVVVWSQSLVRASDGTIRLSASRATVVVGPGF